MLTQAKAKIIRKVQTTVSIFIFIAVFFFCWFSSGFDLREIQVSYFGVGQSDSLLWNISTVLISICMYINVFLYIKFNDRIENKKLFYIAFGVIFLLLAISGAINMHHKIHNISAWLYFLLFPLVVFLMGFSNRKSMHYKEWLMHTIFSIILVVGTLSVINLWHGKAVAEVVNSATVFSWNFWILLW